MTFVRKSYLAPSILKSSIVSKSRILILIADDDAEDRELIEEAILEVNPDIIFHQVHNGQEALDFLQSGNGHRLPDAILLDYSMPKLNGAQVLAKLCGEEQYTPIPKFVWSTSNMRVHISECLQHGATKYFIKPDSPAKLKAIAGEILAVCGKDA